MKSVPLLGYVLIAGVAVLLYAVGIDIPYFADDFHWVFDNPLAQSANCLTRIYSPNTFYRPIQACFLLRVQAAVGPSTIPIHVVHILMHALCSCLVCWAVFRFKRERSPALVAGLAMAVSQANVLAVANNDTLSQLGGTLFGVASLVAFFESNKTDASSAKGGRRALLYLSGLCLLFLSLLSKESSVCFPLLAAGVIALAPAGRARLGRRMLQIAAGVSPIVMTTLGYIVLRGSLHAWPASYGHNMYDFWFGLNVLRNLAALGLSALLPFSSVDVNGAHAMGNTTLLPAYIVGAGLWAAGLAWGLTRSRNRRLAAWFGVAAMVATVPTVFMNHVSELYTYNCMPFVAAIIGLGLGPLLGSGGLEGLRRRAAFVVGLALLLSHGLAVQSKVRMMRDNGVRASELLSAVVSVARSAPADATLRLINPKHDRPTYSAFQLSGFDVLRDAGEWIRVSAGRPDLKVLLVEWDEACVPANGRVCLTIEDGHVVSTRR